MKRSQSVAVQCIGCFGWSRHSKWLFSSPRFLMQSISIFSFGEQSKVFFLFFSSNVSMCIWPCTMSFRSSARPDVVGVPAGSHDNISVISEGELDASNHLLFSEAGGCKTVEQHLRTSENYYSTTFPASKIFRIKIC